MKKLIVLALAICLLGASAPISTTKTATVLKKTLSSHKIVKKHKVIVPVTAPKSVTKTAK